MATIRKRTFTRKHGPPQILWLVDWHDRPGHKRSRGFQTPAEAEAWRARLLDDPALGTGEKLQQIRESDERERFRRLAGRRAAERPSATDPPAPPSAEVNGARVGTQTLRIDDIVAALRREMRAPLARIADATADMRELLRRDLLEIKRRAGVVEEPKAPRTSRRRPIE